MILSRIISKLRLRIEILFSKRRDNFNRIQSYVDNELKDFEAEIGKKVVDDKIVFVFAAHFNTVMPIYISNLIQEILKNDCFLIVVNTGVGLSSVQNSQRYFYFKRENLGYDFTTYLSLTGFLERNFLKNFIIFFNDSVWYLKPELFYLEIENLKKEISRNSVVSLTNSYEIKPHLQSFFYAGFYEQVFQPLFIESKKSFVPVSAKFKEYMVGLEFRFSEILLSLSIIPKAMYDYFEIRNEVIPRSISLRGNPTHQFPEYFVKAKIPFIKKDIFTKSINPDFFSSSEFKSLILSNSNLGILRDLMDKCT